MMAKTTRVPTVWKVKAPRSGLPRIPFVQRCRLRDVDGEHDGLICDLSPAGVFVRMEPVLPKGALLGVSFRLFPSDEEPVRATAEVVWQNDPDAPSVADLPPGCGLRFLDLPEADSHRIDVLVRAYGLSFASSVTG